jgi:transcriptional antiterminator NusG
VRSIEDDEANREVLRGPGAEEEAGVEGGEALAGVGALEVEETAAGSIEPPSAAIPKWHVLWTRSNCEQLVHDQLHDRGFDLFLPRIGVWRRLGGRKEVGRVPLFPGYLFLRHAIDKRSYLEVRRTRGLVALLGESWDRLAHVPEVEIESIRTLLRSDLPVQPHPYLKEGRRARVIRGPLAGVEGVLVGVRPEKGLLVLSIDLLRRSVAVEIDCTAVTAA